MLKELYYKITSILIKPKVASMGKDCKIRMKGRILSGKYVHLADAVEIENNYTIAVYPSFGGKDNPVLNDPDKGVWLGERGSYNRNLTIYCADRVFIGKDVLFGSNILVTDNEHGTNPEGNVSYRHQPLNAREVSIGNGCWIGEGAIILSGTSIGEKSIVAAGAVVKGDFPGMSIIAGVPAKIIRIWSSEKKQWIKPE